VEGTTILVGNGSDSELLPQALYCWRIVPNVYPNNDRKVGDDGDDGLKFETLKLYA
jgi:hypothetical protein